MSQRRSSYAGSARWARDLAESSTPIFLLDAKRRLVLFNRGCTEWTGWPEADVLGQTCDYATHADANSVEAVLAACAPPAEVWQDVDAEVPYYIPHRSAAPRSGRISFQPLVDAEQRVLLIVGRFLPVLEPAAPPPATPAQLLHAELAALRHEVRRRYGEDSVIAVSPPMRRVIARLAIAAKSSDSLLLVGEIGAGREYLARLLHGRGPHSQQAFVPIDCRRTSSGELKRMLKHLQEDHRESEPLRTGTLFLRDIDAAPRDVQDRLAEWLTARTAKDAPRLMAAANGDLEPLLERDEFHRELYYALTTTVIDVPALKQRPEDIVPLAQYFLEEENRHSARQLSGFHPDAVEALRRYRWPGNVAELRSVVSDAAERATGPLVMPADFPLSFRAGEDAQRLGPPAGSELAPLDAVLEQLERTHIQSALRMARDNLTRAAELLGLSRPKLYRRLEALGLLIEESGGEPPPE